MQAETFPDRSWNLLVPFDNCTGSYLKNAQLIKAWLSEPILSLVGSQIMIFGIPGILALIFLCEKN